MSGLQRKRPYVVVAAVLAAVAAPAAASLPILESSDAGATSGPPRTEPLNVVVIMTDDQAAGSERTMDTVQRLLARRGTTFRRAFSTFPRCCPSRATFLTGQFAHNHGVLGNRPPSGGYSSFRSATGTLPEALQGAGYRTGHIGRYLNGYGRRGNPPTEVPPGWDEWHGFPKLAMYDYRVNHNGELERFGSLPSDYQTDVIARRAEHFIAAGAESDAPFFLSLAPLAPHTESGRAGRGANPRPAPRHSGRFASARFAPPPSFNESDVSDKPRLVRKIAPLDAATRASLAERYRDRRASLLAVDDLVRRVVSALRRRGALASTLIVFTSDNGFLLGEHRRKLKGALYEESVRVPLIVRGPGVPAGAEAGQVVGNVDLAPTILAAAGAEPDRVQDGRSLLGLARDPRRGRHRALLLENQRSAAIRTRRFAYVEHPGGERELYDLRRDPFQLRSLHADPRLAGAMTRLARRLAVLRDCAGAGCRVSAPRAPAAQGRAPGRAAAGS